MLGTCLHHTGSDMICSHARQTVRCVMLYRCALICMSEAIKTTMGSRVESCLEMFVASVAGCLVKADSCNNRPQAQAHVDLRSGRLSVVIIIVYLYTSQYTLYTYTLVTNSHCRYTVYLYQQSDVQYMFTVCAFVTDDDHDLCVTLLLPHQKASVVPRESMSQICQPSFNCTYSFEREMEVQEQDTAYAPTVLMHRLIHACSNRLSQLQPEDVVLARTSRQCNDHLDMAESVKARVSDALFDH